jgi:hypothetical protein
MNVAIEESYVASGLANVDASATMKKFVQALAKRQARIDSGRQDEPRTLH